MVQVQAQVLGGMNGVEWVQLILMRMLIEDSWSQSAARLLAAAPPRGAVQCSAGVPAEPVQHRW